MSEGPERVMIEMGLKEAPPGYVPPRYKRNKDGSVAHHYDCPRALTGMAWFWPETEGITNDADLLQRLIAIPWIRPCRVCFAL